MERIGLALSGGGIRAAVFHLGVLKGLAELGFLERVSCLSTVSGGSLIVGLLLSKNDYRWPTGKEYLSRILPEIRAVLTRKDLQRQTIVNLLVHPWRYRNNASALAHTIQSYWNVKKKLCDLKATPEWIINATTFETGKDWRFTWEKMGDYVCGYVFRPTLPLSSAMAASAGLPFLIGSLSLKTDRYSWLAFDKQDENIRSRLHVVHPPFKRLHLWDGGVYENLGVEALYKDEVLQRGIDTLIVSDASATLTVEKKSHLLLYKNLMRLIHILYEQIRSIRARDLIDFFNDNPNSGFYLKIGDTVESIRKEANANVPFSLGAYMDQRQVDRVKYYPTTLKKLPEEDFDLILRHGTEVVRAMYECYGKRKI